MAHMEFVKFLFDFPATPPGNLSMGDVEQVLSSSFLLALIFQKAIQVLCFDDDNSHKNIAHKWLTEYAESKESWTQFLILLNPEVIVDF